MCSLNWSFLEKVPQNYEHLTNWQISSVFKDSLNSGPLPLQNGICMVFPAWFSVDWLAKHPEMMWVFWFLIFSLDSPLSYLISPCSPEIAACYFFLQCWRLNLGVVHHLSLGCTPSFVLLCSLSNNSPMGLAVNPSAEAIFPASILLMAFFSAHLSLPVLS